ncbi:MAG: hypothetical protein EOO05_12010 [Chitinophagaceae bacterium]|nr:MAG: hypothetical protein EOO05_12010 [Chitinophagaceae bacterium]
MTGRRLHTKAQGFASVFMMAALLWLTISVPFVYAGQQKIAAEKKVCKLARQQQQKQDDDRSSCNPFGNNTEEKAPSGVNTLSEEYLHHSEDLFHAVELFLSHHHVHSVDEYVSYHGEMLCPPPNALS